MATIVTAQKLVPAETGDAVDMRTSPAEVAPNIWVRTSTWGLLLLLLYFALDGVSPFVNEPTSMRVVSTASAGGIVAERLSKLIIFFACMICAVYRHQSVRRMSMQMKLVTSFPILALALAPLSQQPTRTLSSGTVLLGSTVLLYYIMVQYTLDQVLELLLVLGTATTIASVVFALALPQYGLDQMGGHSNAWKGIFSAKNYLGNIALFFLTVAVSYRPRTNFFRSVRLSQILLCLTTIAFSHAATAYLLTVLYIVYFVILRNLRRFRKKDYFLVCTVVAGALFAVMAVIVLWPDFLFELLGKDVTLTGRTEIWGAVIDSILKRPLVGYGYGAFWLGLKGESYHVILAVSWVLAQAQSGFLDVTLELGVGGLAIAILVFGFAFRDGMACLFRSRDHTQLWAVEWYLAIVVLTLIYNLDESFLFEPQHLGSMMFLLACVGLKIEWLRLARSQVAMTRTP
jgi:exopolysaccharide production protein ExoQ